MPLWTQDDQERAVTPESSCIAAFGKLERQKQPRRLQTLTYDVFHGWRPEETLNTWWDYSVFETHPKYISIYWGFGSQKGCRQHLSIFLRATKKTSALGQHVPFYSLHPKLYLFPYKVCLILFLSVKTLCTLCLWKLHEALYVNSQWARLRL